MPEDLGLETEAAGRTIAAALAAGRSTLSEVEAKVLLACYGIPIVPTEVASSSAEVATHAARWIGSRGACVVKILSDDITHKSDVGGVRLGLERAEEARHAAEDMLERVTRLSPQAPVRGFTVQPMVRRPKAIELIAGMAVDPTFGPLLMLGAGGTAVEVVRDTAHALPPLDLNLARDLMRQTRVWRLLQGYRDRPAADVTAIAEALVCLGYLVARHPEIREVDINPLLARWAAGCSCTCSFALAIRVIGPLPRGLAASRARLCFSSRSESRPCRSASPGSAECRRSAECCAPGS
jgi:acetyltransferase